MPLWLRPLLLSFAVSSLFATTSVAAPLVLFDESHGQQFRIADQGELGLAALAELYRASGFQVESRTGRLTREALKSVDVLVVSGPFSPLNEDELSVVDEFIARGGGLALMLHIAPPARTLLVQLEVDYANGVLHESHHVLGKDPLNFTVNALSAHRVTEGLKSFSVYGAWALRGTAPQSAILAQTSPLAWVDLNHDKRLSEGDAVQSFGVLVVGEAGAGRYAVFGDDALFQNRFLDAANRQLAVNLARWLAAK